MKPPPGNPTDSFENAVKYAGISRDSYRQWLIDGQYDSLYVGAGALALGGAAIGLATSGGSTAATTALAVAGGAGIAADQWLLGTPTDAKHKAYTTAMAQLQCVINDAWGETPRPSAPPSVDQMPMPALFGDVKRKGAYQDLLESTKILSDNMTALSGEISAPANACTDEGNLRDARLALAEAMAMNHRATVLAIILARAPVDIVRTVDSIDTAAFTQSQASAPDITKLPTISPLSTKAPSAGTTPPKIAPTITIAPVLSPCDQLKQFAEATRTATATLDRMLAGVVPAQPGFAECLKAPAKSDGTDTPPKQQATAPMAVLPGLHPYAPKKSSVDLTITGGHAPFDLIVVDPGIDVASKPGSESNFSIKVEPTVKSGQTLRLLITDSAGEQALVSVQIVDAVASGD